MNELIRAINGNATVTENGMATKTSSMSASVDFFFKAGASRGRNIITDFSKAYAESPEIATRLAQWVRDIRGGAGERQMYKDILVYLAGKDTKLVERLLPKTVEHGRWDDLLALAGTSCQDMAFEYISNALMQDDGLCAKWMPRKGKVAVALRQYMGLSPKSYRKLLVLNTKVVEQLMSDGKWSDIDYEKLPSLAASRYQKAFKRQDETRYSKYVDGLSSGETTINSGALYPYDVIKSIKMGGNVQASEAQWKGLVDYMEGSTESVLPIVDVSYSMTDATGVNGINCMDAAISLGLYISERSEGPFKDTFITFESNPHFVTVAGSLVDRFRQAKDASWGGSTSIENTYKLLLNSAVKGKVPQSDMPTKLLILSDMQFNQSDRRWDESAHEMAKRMYSQAGYEIPEIIYWNLRAKAGVPVEFDTTGAALISGLSPSVMRSVLSCSTVTPIDMMLETIMLEKYNF